MEEPFLASGVGTQPALSRVRGHPPPKQAMRHDHDHQLQAFLAELPSLGAATPTILAYARTHDLQLGDLVRFSDADWRSEAAALGLSVPQIADGPLPSSAPSTWRPSCLTNAVMSNVVKKAR